MINTNRANHVMHCRTTPYSCLTYSDALTHSEVFQFYLPRKTKFRRNILMAIFVNTYWMKPPIEIGLFLYEDY